MQLVEYLHQPQPVLVPGRIADVQEKWSAAVVTQLFHPLDSLFPRHRRIRIIEAVVDDFGCVPGTTGDAKHIEPRDGGVAHTTYCAAWSPLEDHPLQLPSRRGDGIFGNFAERALDRQNVVTGDDVWSSREIANVKRVGVIADVDDIEVLDCALEGEGKEDKLIDVCEPFAETVRDVPRSRDDLAAAASGLRPWPLAVSSRSSNAAKRNMLSCLSGA